MRKHVYDSATGSSVVNGMGNKATFNTVLDTHFKDANYGQGGKLSKDLALNH